LKKKKKKHGVKLLPDENWQDTGITEKVVKKKERSQKKKKKKKKKKKGKNAAKGVEKK